MAEQLKLRFEWWTPDQAAAALGCTPDHVRDLLRRGRLTGKLERRRWWVDPQSVARYLGRKEQNP